MATIINLDGSRVTLDQTSLVFGREDVCYPRMPSNLQYAELISRQQFRLKPQPGGVLTLTSLGTNPTKVLRTKPTPSALFLSQGEEAVLREGDRVLLLAANPLVYVAVEEVGVGGSMEQREQQQQQQQQPEGQNQRPPEQQRDNAQRGQQQPEQCKQHVCGRASGDGEPAAKRARSEGDGSQQHSEPEPRGVQQQQQELVHQSHGPVPVCLILVGVQGSGKSTFAQQLADRSHASWVRVNQDSMPRNGGKTPRDMCIEAAQKALAEGKGCIIDRMNLDPGQRAFFIRQVAQPAGVEAHCVVLHLPVKTCMSRAAARTDHEGGLQGNSAHVYRTINGAYKEYKEAGPPQAREGLASVLVCESDAEVEAALQVWAQYGPGRTDVQAEYERLRPKPKPVKTIDQFFRKQTASQEGGDIGTATVSAGGTAVSEQEPRQQQRQQQKEQQPAATQLGAPASAGAGASASQQQDALTPLQQAQPPQQEQQQRPGSGGAGGNAFAVMMAAAKQQRQGGGGTSGSASGSKAPAAAPAALPGSGGHTFARGGDFATALVDIAAHPERYRSSKPEMVYDDTTVLINDKFPKSKCHVLVVSRDPRLQGPLCLTASDVLLLEHMQRVAEQYIQREKSRDPRLVFKMGFHAAPSLRQLHLHVISQDFAGPYMKDKKHWNSFAHPDFFMELHKVLRQLRECGRLEYRHEDKAALLKAGLRCHRCRAALANMPKLKAHIAACKGGGVPV